MLFRLKKHFKDFYGQFGCYLWTANILLAVPLMLRVISDILKVNNDWQNLLHDDTLRIAIYNLIFFCLTTYLPIVSQITSLVFGFVRHKQVQMFGRRNTDRDGVNRSPGEGREPEDDDNIYEEDVSDLNVSDNGIGYFDPPIENYRFYYHG